MRMILTAAALFAAAPLYADDVPWAFGQRLSSLEKRVDALEGKAKAPCPCGPACPRGGTCGDACPCPAVGALTTNPALAAVRLTYGKGGPGWSGTAVGPTRVVTCAHGLPISEAKSVGVTVHQGGKSLPATVGRYDLAADVMVLDVKDGGLTYAAVGNDPTPGTPVEMHGAGIAGGMALSRKAGVVTGTTPWRGGAGDPVSGHLMTRSTVPSVPGDSGAGIFAGGKLVAVNSGGNGDSLASRAGDIRSVVGEAKASPYGPAYSMHAVPGVGEAWTHKAVVARIQAGTYDPAAVTVDYPGLAPVTPGVQSYSGQESLEAFAKCPERGSVEGYTKWLEANPANALTATPPAGSVCGPNGCGTGVTLKYPAATYPQGNTCGPGGCGVQGATYGNPFQGGCPGGVCPAPTRRGVFR